MSESISETHYLLMKKGQFELHYSAVRSATTDLDALLEWTINYYDFTEEDAAELIKEKYLVGFCNVCYQIIEFEIEV